jgi:D-glycero-D-manno-heptose 1,7-bisphosphate phosphatase
MAVKLYDSNCRPALFLDRDGVINIDYGYVFRKEDFHFIDGIFDLVRCAHDKGYRIVIITNQSGIGRGYYTEAQFNELTEWMCERFFEIGAPISRVYFSPYHPKFGVGNYLRDDFLRKPNPGMIFKARDELNIDLANSLLIGDNLTDIVAGNSAEIGMSLLLSSAPPDDGLFKLKYKCIETLLDAFPYIEAKGE